MPPKKKLTTIYIITKYKGNDGEGENVIVFVRFVA